MSLMPWKRTLNQLLRRATGYELVAAGEPTRANDPELVNRLIKTAEDFERLSGVFDRKIRRLGRHAAKLGQRNAPAQGFPRDFDLEYQEIVNAVRAYTMTSNDKLHALISATKYVHRYGIPGAIVECGVWRGGSMHAVARTLDRVGEHGRDLYLYDTFAGMTEPTPVDVRYDGEVGADLLASNSKTSGVWAYASLDDVRRGFEQVPYPSDRVRFIEGRVEETIPAQAPDQIAILRLDTDWYESTMHELDHLYPRLVSGGVLMIDDYGYWQGSRLATNEFLEKTGDPLLLFRMGSGRVAVKP